MKLGKRILAFVLALLVCISCELTYIPVTWTAYAMENEEDEVFEYAIENEEDEVFETEDGNSGIEIADGDAVVLDADAGEVTFYISGDVTLGTNLVIPSGVTATLNLNGHVLRGNGNGSVITVQNGGILNVVAGDTSIVHYGTLTNAISWNNTAGDTTYAAGLWVWDGSATQDTVNVVGISGGIITGGNAGTGSGVYVANGGTFTMTGGTIVGNESTFALGGALGVDVGATAELSDVNIWYNYNGVTKGKGAGIACEGTLTIHTGNVKGNRCDDSANNGSMGGGLYFETANARGTLTNVTIEENYAEIVAGGIAVYNGATVELDGGYIQNNSTSRNEDRNGLNINGAACSATISNLTVEDGIGVVSSTLKVGSGCVVSKAIQIRTNGNVEYNSDEYRVENSSSSSLLLIPVVQTTVGDAVCCLSGTPDTTYGTIQEAYEALKVSNADSDDVIVLLKDFVQDGTLTIDSTVTIDLNGHVFSGNATDRVITIENGGTLILTDSTYGTDTAPIHYGTVGADHVWKWSLSDTGTTAITGGIITGGRASTGGGGICVKDGGVLAMTGITIAGNEQTSASYAGGGLRIEKGATATLTDVTVCNNKGNGGGGGIYAAGELNMTGGSIRDNYLTNSTSWNGSGLLVLGWNQAAAAELKNVVIENNVSATETGGYSGAGICVGCTNNKNTQWATLSMSGCTVQNNRYNGEIVDMSVSDQCSVTLTGDTTTILGKIVLNNNSSNPPRLTVNTASLPTEAAGGVTADIAINNQKESVTWKNMLYLPDGYGWDSDENSSTYQKIVKADSDDTSDDEYVYFDLAAGNIEITYVDSDGSTQYKGYIYDNTTGASDPVTKEITGTYTRDKVFYVYQSSSTNRAATGKVLVDGKTQMVLPEYKGVSVSTVDENGQTTNQSWSDYITNNRSVENVIEAWDTAIEGTGREACSNYIKITKAASATVILDNLYSIYNSYNSDNGSKVSDGPLKIEMSERMQTTLTLQLKGDSRFHNIYYKSTQKNMGTLVIESASGDASSNDGSMTVAPFVTNLSRKNYPNCLAIIGAADLTEYGLTFSGGTVFAGFPAQDNHVWGIRSQVAFATCIGGGNNNYGEVTVTGGRLTAVSNGTSPAIGGGGGYDLVGGCGTVDISGGEVYAYATGIYSIDDKSVIDGVQRTVGFVPTTAIGGSSTFTNNAKGGTQVKISGGKVYAESLGGTAIGGGNSQACAGGSATVSISGNAEVTAVSSAGTAGDKTRGEGYYTEATQGNAIGGGCGVVGGSATVTISDSAVVNATAIGGGTAKMVRDKNGEIITAKDNDGNELESNGGDATLKVSGGTIKTGTIGGGAAENENAHIGSATVTITGGDIVGQFLLQNVSEEKYCTFTMSGGRLHDTNANDKNYVNRKQDGGAVWMDDSKGIVTITGGTIENCSAENGGAIYMIAGTVTMTGGIIDSCTAYNGSGGAIYQGGGDVNVTGSTIQKNAASCNGGGIYVNGGDFTMTGGLISENSAYIEVLSKPYTAELASTLYSLERGNGGGVYVKNGSFMMDNGTVSDNRCSRYGGGIYVYSVDTSKNITLKGGEISKNKAAQCGGGITAFKTDILLTYGEDGTNGVSITENESVNGGGIYVRYNATLRMEGGNVTGNHAVSLNKVDEQDEFYGVILAALKASLSATADGSGSQDLFGDNNDDWGGNGGGIMLHNASMDFSGEEGNALSGVVSNNTADRNGGGLYLLQQATVDRSDTLTGTNNSNLSATIENGNIMNNTAGLHGGGIAMFQTATKTRTSAQPQATAEISGQVEISGNEAACGGGFYVGGGTLTVTGGIMTQNKAVGTPNEDVTTAANDDDNVGVGGGIYVYNLGKLYLKITEAEITKNNLQVGVYSNEADFAADDIYCAGNTESEIEIPAVSSMYLEDYEGHVIGKAIGWYLDYPKGDTTATDTTKNEIRYRVAEDAQDDQNKVLFALFKNSTAITRTVTDYTCLTLGFAYLRINVTIENTLTPTTDDTIFDYTVTVKGKVSDEELEIALKEPSLSTTAMVFDLKESQSYEGVSYEVESDGSEADSDDEHVAVIHFRLGNGEKVVLEGIPIFSDITIEEIEKDATYTTAHTYDGKTSLGRIFSKMVEDKYEYVLFSNSKDAKQLSYYIPVEDSASGNWTLCKSAMYPINWEVTKEELETVEDESFEGWYLDENCNNEVSSAIVMSDDVSLYGLFSTDEEDDGSAPQTVTLTLVYDQMWHDYNWIGLGDTPDKIIEMDVGTIVSLNDENLAGWTWYEDADYQNAITDVFTMNEDKTIYANATLGGAIGGGDLGNSTTPKTYTLYYCDADGNELGSYSKAAGIWNIWGKDLKTYTDYTDVPEGYEFKGWLSEKGNTDTVIKDTDSLSMISGDKSIYAWLEKTQAASNLQTQPTQPTSETTPNQPTKQTNETTPNQESRQTDEATPNLPVSQTDAIPQELLAEPSAPDISEKKTGPATGDDSHIVFWISMQFAGVVLASISAALMHRKKHNK